MAAIKRNSRLKRDYGITSEDFSQMLGAQMALCKACRAPMSMGSRDGTACHVDHCHTTGKVRGLLCHRCNVTLGHANEDAARLRGLATYIEAADGILGR
jgi:hypothetical protein